MCHLCGARPIGIARKDKQPDLCWECWFKKVFGR